MQTVKEFQEDLNIENKKLMAIFNEMKKFANKIKNQENCDYAQLEENISLILGKEYEYDHNICADFMIRILFDKLFKDYWNDFAKLFASFYLSMQKYDTKLIKDKIEGIVKQTNDKP